MTYQNDINTLAIIQEDRYLKPYEEVIKRRHNKPFELLGKIIFNEGSLEQFADSYKRYGVVRGTHQIEGKEVNGWIIREWAPNFEQMWIFGDFNNWNRNTTIPL